MSLEEALNRLSDLTERNNELLEKVLSKAGPASSSEESKADKPAGRRGRSPTKEAAEEPKSDGDTDSVTFADIKDRLSKWLGEFAKAEDKDNPDGVHPEVQARKDALKKAYGSEKLKVEKLGDIEKNPAKIEILNSWFVDKALKVDRGHGIGRFVADPAPAEEAGSDDLDL